MLNYLDVVPKHDSQNLRNKRTHLFACMHSGYLLLCLTVNINPLWTY